MFCHITANWRGRPLSSLELIVNLVAGTTTQKGLTIQAGLDLGAYEKGIQVSDKAIEGATETRRFSRRVELHDHIKECGGGKT